MFGAALLGVLAGIVGAAWVELRDVEELRWSALYWLFAGCAGLSALVALVSGLLVFGTRGDEGPDDPRGA